MADPRLVCHRTPNGELDWADDAGPWNFHIAEMTATAVSSSTPSGASKTDRIFGVATVAILFLALWTSWSRFPAVWTNDRSHGWVIGGLCLWLLWRDRAEFKRVNPAPAYAIPLLFALSLLWMFAVALSAQAVHLGLAPLILLAWLLAVRGGRSAGHGVQIAALFMLAVPVWEALTGILQKLTVLANNLLLFVTRIPARVEGTMIHLPAGSLHVANSCAGINYLMSGLTLGACYAFLFTAQWRTRLKIVVAAGAVSILSNWIRVFGLVCIGYATDMRSSLMKDHVVYGWIVFAVFMPLFFHLARRIELADASKGTVTVRAATPSLEVPPKARLSAAIFAAVSGPALYFFLSSTQRPAVLTTEPSGVAIPVSLAAAPSARDTTSWEAGFSGADSHLSGVATVSGTVVQVDRFVYGAQDQSSEMIGGGNAIAVDSAVAGRSIIGPLDDQLRTVIEVVIRTPDQQGRLAWYWYSVKGVSTSSSARAKLLELWAFLGRSPSSEIIVLSAACSNRNCLPARSALFKAATGREMPAARQP